MPHSSTSFFNCGKRRKNCRMLWAAGLIALLLLTAGARPFDAALNRLMQPQEEIARQENTRGGEFLQFARVFGKADTLILLVLILALGGKRRQGLALLLALLFLLATVQPLKSIVGRQRPQQGNFHSFPSGDTATAFTLPSVRVSPVAAGLSWPLALGAGASRLFYQQHYLADVFFGAFLGLLGGLVGRALARRWRWRLPNQRWLWRLLAAFLLVAAALAFLDQTGLARVQHRHLVQFVSWFGPAAIIFILRPRWRFARRARLGGLKRQTVKPGKWVFLLLGGGLLIYLAPGLAGWRNPALSALMLFCLSGYYITQDKLAGRLAAARLAWQTSGLIALIYAAGYFSGVL